MSVWVRAVALDAEVGQVALALRRRIGRHGRKHLRGRAVRNGGRGSVSEPGWMMHRMRDCKEGVQEGRTSAWDSGCGTGGGGSASSDLRTCTPETQQKHTHTRVRHAQA